MRPVKVNAGLASCSKVISVRYFFLEMGGWCMHLKKCSQCLFVLKDSVRVTGGPSVMFPSVFIEMDDAAPLPPTVQKCPQCERCHQTLGSS